MHFDAAPDKKEGKVSEERLRQVQSVVEGLIKIVNNNGLKEVESAQPENLNQYEATDDDGNEISYIRGTEGHLASPIEVRDSKGKLMAQSWDGKNWAVNKYIDAGVIDFSLP